MYMNTLTEFNQTEQYPEGIDATQILIRGYGFRPKPIYVKNAKTLGFANLLIQRFLLDYMNSGLVKSKQVSNLLHFHNYDKPNMSDASIRKNNGYWFYSVKHRFKLKRPNQFNKNDKPLYKNKRIARMARYTRNHRVLSKNWWNGRIAGITIKGIANCKKELMPIIDFALLLFYSKTSLAIAIDAACFFREECEDNCVIVSKKDLDLYYKDYQLRLVYLFRAWLLEYLNTGYDLYDDTKRLNAIVADNNMSDDYIRYFFAESDNRKIYKYIR